MLAGVAGRGSRHHLRGGRRGRGGGVALEWGSPLSCAPRKECGRGAQTS